jgi:Zn-dependent protease with chaperone function
MNAGVDRERSRTRTAGVPIAWPSPIAVIAIGTLPVLALLFKDTVREMLADLPLGRGDAIATIWVGLAIATLLVAALEILALPVVLALAGQRPSLLSAFLGRGVRVVLIGLAVLVALEALLASGVVLILEHLIFGRAFPGSIAITIVGGFAGVFYLLRATASYPRRRVEFPAFVIDPEREPKLAKMNRDLAARLSIPPADHILIGPELMVGVTDAPTWVDDRTHVGTTLYLSWPLLRILSSDQTAAVIAHELAHVAASHLDSGRELDRGIDRAREALVKLDTEVYDNPAARIGTQPAAIWIRWMLAATLPVVAMHQRPRELDADRIAADLVGADVLGGALVTIGVAEMLAPVWKHLATDPRAVVLARGGLPTDAFADAVEKMLASEDLDALLAAEDTTSTHPTVAERLRAIAVVPTPSIAPDPAITTLLSGGREIGSTLSHRIREGPRSIKSDVINALRFEVGLAGILTTLVVLGAFTLFVAASGNELGNQANAVGWFLVLMAVIALAGVVYFGLQQEIVFDDAGVSATGWFRRLIDRRNPVVAWAEIRHATLGHVRSIKVATSHRSFEIHGTWLNDRDIRRVIEGLRSHGIPVRFKFFSRGFDDERRVVVWFIGNAFLVPTLRRADDGGMVETEPVRQVELEPSALFAAIAKGLDAPPKAIGPRARVVDLRARETDGRRVVIAGSRNLSTVRIDGFDDHWWDESPPDAGRVVGLIFEVFEIEWDDEGFDDDVDVVEPAG